jgi:hypothetical protein
VPPVSRRTPPRTFAELLDFHLTRGTRPDGGPSVTGRRWTNSEFADAVRASDERNVRNWRTGRNVPIDIKAIERELFGDNTAYDDWRLELREAHQLARTSAKVVNTEQPATAAVTPLPASNIPIRVPTHFMGRDGALTAIETALKRYEGRVAITALHGMRGVGKTTLAAAYADRRRGDYRATWWFRAQTEATLRADLVALGIRLGWADADANEEQAVGTVMERLRHEGDRILLIFDNAIDADELKAYLPRGGGAQVLITSNAHTWRGVAEPVEIQLWPRQIGADYLIARTGRTSERAAAEALSEVLGGLPLAHEQAAAYCERMEPNTARGLKPRRLDCSTTHAMHRWNITTG